MHKQCVITYLIASSSVHDHSWPDRKWGYREYCHDHPVRTAKCGVHPKNHTVLV